MMESYSMWPCRNNSVVLHQSGIHTEKITAPTLKIRVAHIGCIERQILPKEATKPRVRNGKGSRRSGVRHVGHDGREIGASDEPIPQELIGRGSCALPNLVDHNGSLVAERAG